MKRFHIHLGVKNLDTSIQFYSTLFAQRPAKVKPDYAKWMLEDPRINFAISTRGQDTGVNHLGIQVDTPPELDEIKTRLKNADLGVFNEGETTCCYAKSDKVWVSDPAGVPWETYHTMTDAKIFKDTPKTDESACCAPTGKTEFSSKSCC